MALALWLPPAVFGEWPGRPAWPALSLLRMGWCWPSPWSASARCCSPADRLTAIVSLGIQGLAVALIFLLLGAPDLAFTQFMVETLSVVILALVMTRLSCRRPTAARPARGCATASSRSPAAAASRCSAQVVALPFDATLSDFFEANAKPSPTAATSSTSSSSTSAASTPWAKSRWS